MLKEVHERTRKKMEANVESMRHDLSTVRTGRASLAILDEVRVDAYGQQTPLNQLATLAVPEGNLITVQPWNQAQISDIERAILKANIGLNPTSDGKIIRLPVPPLTEERRKELAKKIHQLAEGHKTGVRNVRREANEEIKKLEKDKAVSQDEAKVGLKEIQDLTDEFTGKIDQLASAKEKEILEF